MPPIREAAGYRLIDAFQRSFLVTVRMAGNVLTSGSASPFDRLELLRTPPLVEPDAEIREGGQLVLARPLERVWSLAAARMRPPSRDGPATGAGIVGRGTDAPAVRKTVQYVERGALTGSGVGHVGRISAL